MIRSLKSRKLKKFWVDGDAGAIGAEYVPKVRLILDVLDQARSPEDMDRPSFAFHALKGNLKGRFAVTVRANWRITFGFDLGTQDAIDVDFEDYH